MTRFNALMKRCKWSLTVRDSCLVDYYTLLTAILSDGKQARVAAMEIGEKVQVVIEGARGLSG